MPALSANTSFPNAASHSSPAVSPRSPRSRPFRNSVDLRFSQTPIATWDGKPETSGRKACDLAVAFPTGRPARVKRDSSDVFAGVFKAGGATPPADGFQSKLRSPNFDGTVLRAGRFDGQESSV